MTVSGEKGEETYIYMRIFKAWRYRARKFAQCTKLDMAGDYLIENHESQKKF